MGYFLLFILFFLLLFSYFISRRDLISPWFISVGVYLISSFVAVINLDRWNETISANTVLIITIALIAFGIGQISSSVFKINKNAANAVNAVKIYKIYVPFYRILIAFSIGLMIVFLMYKRLVVLATIGGYSGSGYILNYARVAIIHYDASWGALIGILQFFTMGIGYVFTYVFVNNILYEGKLFKGFKKNLIYLLPIIPFILVEVMSTGRNGFIRLTAMTLFLGIITWKIQNGWKNANKKNFRLMIIASILLMAFYVTFIKLGDLTGKNLVYSLNDTISVYTGGSIVALDNYLENSQIKSINFGEETLYGLKFIFNKLGFDVLVENRHLEFIHFNNGYSTNVYTALRRYIHDYGYFGMVLVQFLIGLFFGVFYKLIKKRNKADLLIIIYAYVANALIMQSIDDSFLTVFLSVSQVFSIFFIVVCYKFFIKKKYNHL